VLPQEHPNNFEAPLIETKKREVQVDTKSVNTDLCFKGQRVAIEANFECGSFIGVNLKICAIDSINYNY
jgi:hypothetical protein